MGTIISPILQMRTLKHRQHTQVPTAHLWRYVDKDTASLAGSNIREQNGTTKNEHNS